MVSVLRKLPQELLDMIISDAAKIPSGALVKLGPSANDTEQSSEGDLDLRAAGVVLYSLKPYYDIPGRSSRWSNGLIKQGTQETSLVNETGTIFTGTPEVASELFGLALHADLNGDKKVLPNLRRMIWDARLKDPESAGEDNTAFDEEEPLDHLTWLSSATQKLSKLHNGRPIDLYVYTGEQDWSEHCFMPSEGFVCWQGSLSGLPRIDSYRTKTDLKLVLEVSGYCQDDTNDGQGTSGPSQQFRDKLSTVCRYTRAADEGSTIGVYLVLDDPSEQATKDRLEGWKDELEQIVNSFGGQESGNNVDLQVYVGERPQLSFYYEL